MVGRVWAAREKGAMRYCRLGRSANSRVSSWAGDRSVGIPRDGCGGASGTKPCHTNASKSGSSGTPTSVNASTPVSNHEQHFTLEHHSHSGTHDSKSHGESSHSDMHGSKSHGKATDPEPKRRKCATETVQSSSEGIRPNVSLKRPRTRRNPNY